MTNYLFIGIGLSLLIYFCFVVFYTKNPISFALFWLVGALTCFTISLLKSYILKSKILNCIYLLLIFGIFFFLLLFCSHIFFILKQIHSVPRTNIDCLIILGAGLKGEQITKSLQFRLETAYSYMEAHPDTTAIVSGGKGKGETITEAQAMNRYLIKKGISSDRIKMEPDSTNTYENFLFSKELLEKNVLAVGIVTNNFHIYRALQIAKKLNLQNPVGIPAPTELLIFVHFMVRELFALIKDKLVKNI
mgnify:CR=1 FL=1